MAPDLQQKGVGFVASIRARFYILGLFGVCCLSVSQAQADCFESIRAVGAAADASLRKDPNPQSHQFERGGSRAVNRSENSGLFDHVVDRVEISRATEIFLEHQKAFSRLNVRGPGLTRAQVKKAYEVRLGELRSELFDPKTRLSEDIADLKRDIEALEEAYQELVKAGLAD